MQTRQIIPESGIDGMVGTLVGDVIAFAPEALLCTGVVVLLVLRLFRGLDRFHLGFLSFALTASAFGIAWYQWNSDPAIMLRESGTSIFANMIVYDRFTVFLRLFLCGSSLLVIWLSMLTGIPDREDSADFFSLLMGGTVGMMLMASANHLLMVYIAVEMASLPSYALAGFLKGRRQSSEAALKYVVYGGAASGVMLYGISLLAGRFGTGYLPEVAVSLATMIQQGSLSPLLIGALMMIMIGVAFKLSAVPFHFWCPDVFEGAAAEVAGFLSVVSKGAAVALLGRFVLTMAGLGGDAGTVPDQWKLMLPYLGPILVFFSAVTATFGNLAAYTQTNLKRLLAYSTIAHAGYIMMAVATMTREGLDAAMFYLITYVAMNIGAFGIVAFLRNLTGTEDLSGYRGMIHRAPWLTVALTIFMLSLLGIPPLVGFIGKYQVFAILWQTASAERQTGLYVLLFIGLINTVFSLVYYVRVLKVMIIESPPEDAELSPLRVPPLQHVFAGLLSLVVIAGIAVWDPLAKATSKAVSHFQPVHRAPLVPPPSVPREARQ